MAPIGGGGGAAIIACFGCGADDEAHAMAAIGGGGIAASIIGGARLSACFTERNCIGFGAAPYPMESEFPPNPP